MKLSSYFRLISIFYRNTLISEMEYRLNFWANIGLSLFWLTWASLSVRVYFFQTDEIAGWNYLELLIVMGLFFAMNGYRQMVLEPNLSRLSEYVRMGTLDYILTKPTNNLFLVSFRHLGVFNWVDPLLGMALVILALARLEHVPTLSQVLLFVLLMLAGMVLMYSFNLALQTTTFWFVNVEQADTLVYALLETGRFPVEFYRGWIRTLLTYFIPVAFMTTFPAQALLGRLGWGFGAISVGLALLSLWLATRFWRFGLKFYSGASS